VSLVIDASVWVSVSIPDDAHHATTRQWLERILPSEWLVTPTLGLVETAGAIARRTGSARLAQRAIDAIQQLPNTTVVVPDASLWQQALDVSASRALRGADAVYVALAEALNVPLATWDAEQRARAGRRVRSLSPSACDMAGGLALTARE
jgi:predicted nucleic acid-binding protein